MTFIILLVSAVGLITIAFIFIFPKDEITASASGGINIVDTTQTIVDSTKTDVEQTQTTEDSTITSVDSTQTREDGSENKLTTTTKTIETKAQSIDSEPITDPTEDVPVLGTNKSNKGCDIGFKGTEPKVCEFGYISNEALTITMVGDSHMAQWFTPMLEIAEENNAKLQLITKASCPIIDGITPVARTAQIPHKQCATYVDNLYETLADLDSDIIILTHASSYFHYADGADTTIWPDSWDERTAWENGLKTTFQTLKQQTNAELVFLEDNPRPPSDIPRCLSENTDNPDECSFEFPLEKSNRDADLAKTFGWNVIRTTQWLCQESQCPAKQNGIINYRDASHISQAKAVSLKPELAKALQPIINKP